MIWRLRLGAAGLAVGGLLWAGPVAIDLAGGRFPVRAYIVGVVLAGVSLPLAVQRPSLRAARLAVAGWVLAVAGIASVLLFNLLLLPALAEWAGVTVPHWTVRAGRAAVPPAIGAGLLVLAAAWNRERDDAPVRLALLLVGGAGIALALTRAGRLHGAWYVAAGALWVYVGLAALLDTRRDARL